jgi:hypothetical protein
VSLRPKLERIKTAARGGWKVVVAGTVAPLVVFYAAMAVGGMAWGITLSLVWAVGAFAWTWISQRRPSALLAVTGAMVLARAVTWVGGHSVFGYFAVPVAETVGMGLAFAITCWAGRPLLVALTKDFSPAIGARLAAVHHRHMVRRLSVVWAVAYVGSAVSSLSLLLWTSRPWFMALHQFSGWGWDVGALLASVLVAGEEGRSLLAEATAPVKLPGPLAALTSG